MVKRKKRNFIKDKKGSITDLIMIIGIALFFGMIILIGFKVQSEFNTKIQTMGDIDTYGKTASTTLTGHYTGALDNSFLVLVIGLAIIALILAALVRIHPIFIAFYFIALVLIIFLAGVASNIYTEMASNAQLATQANQLVMVHHVMTYLPLIIGIFGTVLMIIMYKSWRTAQDGF